MTNSETMYAPGFEVAPLRKARKVKHYTRPDGKRVSVERDGSGWIAVAVGDCSFNVYPSKRECIAGEKLK